MEKTKQITISARAIDHSMAGVRQAGFDLHRLLRKCGICKNALKDPTARIPLDKVVMLHRYSTGAMQDEAHGLLQKPMKMGLFRIMALSAVHNRTLHKALQRSIEFYNLFENSLHYSLETNGNQTELMFKRIPGHRILDNFAIDSVMTVNHRFAGWLCNDRIILNQVKVDFPPPDYRKEYKYMFYGAPILFNQEYNSISFDSSYLNHTIVQNEASVESYIRRAPMDIYLPLNAGGEFTQTVRKLVKELFIQQPAPPTLEQLSADMAINSQTLRRRLRDEGTSFNNIKAQVRRDIAIHYLGNPDISIEQISSYTCYAEPSAFIRAFKTWTGFTPLQFRKGLEGN